MNILTGTNGTTKIGMNSTGLKLRDAPEYLIEFGNDLGGNLYTMCRSVVVLLEVFVRQIISNITVNVDSSYLHV